MTTPTTPYVALPAVMVEAAARARQEHVARSIHHDFPPNKRPVVDGEERSRGWYWRCSCGAERDEIDLESGYASADEAVAHEDAAILAAALGVCEVREQHGHAEDEHVVGNRWHDHRCPTASLRHLVITTPAEPDPTVGQP